MAAAPDSCKRKIRYSRGNDTDRDQWESFLPAGVPAQQVHGLLRRERMPQTGYRPPGAPVKGAGMSSQRERDGLSVSRRKHQGGESKEEEKHQEIETVLQKGIEFRGGGQRKKLFRKLRPWRCSGTAEKEMARKGYAWRKTQRTREEKRPPLASSAEGQRDCLSSPRQRSDAENCSDRAGPTQSLGHAAGLQRSSTRPTSSSQPSRKLERRQRVQRQCQQFRERKIQETWRRKSSGELRGSQAQDEEEPTEIRSPLREGSGKRVGCGRTSLPHPRGEQEDSLGQTEDPPAMLSHVRRGVGVDASREVGESCASSSFMLEEHSPNSSRQWGLVSELDAHASERSDQQGEVWWQHGRALTGNLLPPEHGGVGEEYGEASQCQQLGRSEWQHRSTRRRGQERHKEKGQGQRQEERRAQGERDHVSRRDCNMDAVPTKIGANSTVEVLGKSHGAFGRFFRKMHGKPTSGLGQVTSSSPRRFKLFPSRFVLPASVVADTSSKNAKSGRGRKLSWKWTEMVWCLFTFLEGGSPTTEKEQTALAQRAFTAGWSEQHEAYAGLLHEQIHSFVKLRCQEPLSRGTQKLEEIIHKIRPNNSNYEQLAQTIEELMNNATNVKPDRMSLPAEAGILDPKDFLKGDNLRAFETMHEWAPHGDEPIRPPKQFSKSCHVIATRSIINCLHPAWPVYCQLI